MSTNKFRRTITQITESDLGNAENANRPHNELQQNVLFLYENLLTSQSKFAFSSNQLYVNGSTGNDTNTGSVSHPFATIGRALEELEVLIAGNAQVVINVFGNQTYSPSRELSVRLPNPFNTTSASELPTTAAVIKAYNGVVTVSNENGLDNCFNAYDGLLMFKGEWVFSGFQKAINVDHSSLIVYPNTSITCDDCSSCGISAAHGAYAVINGGTLVESGSTYPVLKIKDQSIGSITQDSEISGSVEVTRNSFLSLMDSNISARDVSVLTTDSFRGALVVRMNSFATVHGNSSSDKAIVDFSDKNLQDNRIVVANNSCLDLAYTKLSPCPIGSDNYGIQVEKTSNLVLANGLNYFYNQDGNGVFIGCDSSWQGGDRLGARFIEQDGISVNYSDNSCAHNVELITISGSGGSITPMGFRNIPYGSDQNVVVTADSGYIINQLSLNGSAIPAAAGETSYEIDLDNITVDTNIIVSFVQSAGIKRAWGYALDNAHVDLQNGTCTNGTYNGDSGFTETPAVLVSIKKTLHHNDTDFSGFKAWHMNLSESGFDVRARAGHYNWNKTATGNWIAIGR